MNYQQLYEVLHLYYGDIQWWEPCHQDEQGKTHECDSLEVIIGAVLTQNTAWTSVEKALENIRRAHLFSLKKLYMAPEEELYELIRPAGYYRLKTRRLKNLISWIVDTYGSVTTMFRQPLEDLRRGLLSVNGIGPETADSILLYAGNYASFVIDVYTRRLLIRHAWLDPQDDYESLRAKFMLGLENDPRIYSQFHAFLVQINKEFCFYKKPTCESCPLYNYLPPDGPHPLPPAANKHKKSRKLGNTTRNHTKK